MSVRAELGTAERRADPPDGGAGGPRHLLDFAILDALQAAVYTTDAEGRITYFNQAAADLWGQSPEIGKSEFCGSWRMFWPDGRPMPHDACPMAVALKEGRAITGAEAIAERPDGTRIPFLAYPSPLRDSDGRIVGAVNMLVDITDRKLVEGSAQMLAAIVASSDDAIASKDLNGVIATWNQGAERLFGYSAAEAVGKPVTMLIPDGMPNEEPAILERIRRGERVDHYETMRRRKDGSFVEISLTVSPIKDRDGRVIGASKIARDITERRRVEEQQRLLLKEMSHRVKNLFSLAGSIVSISARHSGSPEDMEQSVRARLAALARAHELTLPSLRAKGDPKEPNTTLIDLVRTMVDPYLEAEDADRIVLSGPDVAVGGRAVTGFSLLLHEFATNAAKYGALSSPAGHLAVEWAIEGDDVHLTWQETGGPEIEGEPEASGFGSLLSDATIAQFGGRVRREWLPEGLTVHLSVPLERLSS